MKNMTISAVVATAILILTMLTGGCALEFAQSNTGSSSGTAPPQSGGATDDSESYGTSDTAAESVPNSVSLTLSTGPTTTRTPLPVSSTSPTSATTKPANTTTTTTPEATTTKATTTTKITTPSTTTLTTKPKVTTTTAKTTTTTTTKATTTTAKPSAPYIVTPSADGAKVYSNSSAVIDASNSSDGYIMVKLKSASSGTYKVVVDAASVSVRYTFSLDSGGSYDVIPLTEGSGTYTVYVLKQISAGKGSTILKQEIKVSISDSFAPFLTPNQYCMYSGNSDCVGLASRLCAGCDELEKIEAVYKYVVKNISYYSTPENAANGYIPDPDRTLSQKSGICFDYASLMAAMLRSQKIPTKVVVGYAGDIYHAWLSVYVKGMGWIDGIIYFDGSKWNRIDPTFAADAYGTDNYQSIVNYMKNNGNYTDMYYY